MTAARPDHAPERVEPPVGLVHALGLLAGLGGAARALAGAPEAASVEGAARTCIDGGRGLLVTLCAPGPVGVALAEAVGGDLAADVRRWRRRALGAAAHAGESLIFGAPAAGHWALARDFLPDIAPLGEAVMCLRGRGRVYMATRSEPETGESWLSVALHRSQPPRETLAALGFTGVWLPAASCLSELFGRPVTEHARPWSVALPLGAAARRRGLVRLGTTAWARMNETPDKPTRLARLVERLGGDGGLAEAAYGLVRGRASGRGSVGVAAEFDVEDGRVSAALFTLRASERTAGRACDNGGA